MKLNKDQIQKIALGAMMLCAIIYGYSSFLLTPLGERRAAALKSTADLAPKIAAAQAQIEKVRLLEEKEADARQILAQIDAAIPQGSPVSS